MGLDKHLTREAFLLLVDDYRKLVLADSILAPEIELEIWRQALMAIAEGKHGTDPPSLIADAALRTRELGL